MIAMASKMTLYQCMTNESDKSESVPAFRTDNQTSLQALPSQSVTFAVGSVIFKSACDLEMASLL